MPLAAQFVSMASTGAILAWHRRRFRPTMEGPSRKGRPFAHRAHATRKRNLARSSRARRGSAAAAWWPATTAWATLSAFTTPAMRARRRAVSFAWSGSDT